jgi:uncharacterized protein with PIN domain
VYLDASALVKLVKTEPETTALRAALGNEPSLVTSRIGVVETARAATRAGDDAALNALHALVPTMDLIELDRTVARRVMEVGPPVVRTLDAIHIASAALLGDALDLLVAYDRRLLDAAASLGLPVASPGAGPA